ncbi:PLP-dependent aminotransferase family protein [Bacillus alkalicellulosilyticus]|uniref:MocR-like pyridoxine biosynthesis transcription factor PdxR n=1 Tax=Alkalihalobacterium alkalicellulosilyticum TaxID=1912214 RepID=UPI0009983C00|nr:PLP-dependent aminotransferase family protein [Bacillus alkalicellulosilyticus]
MAWIEIDRTSDVPLLHQIYLTLRKQILTGVYPAGTKLPSSRELAEKIQVSRTIIVEVYDQLLAEGYLFTKTGSGTFVETGVQLNDVHLANTTNIMEETDDPIEHEIIVDFRSGVPALDLFPRKKWARVVKEVYEKSSPYLFGYNRPEGNEELRQTISNYLYKTRGIACHSRQIIITSGATQALSLLAKLLHKGDEVIIENPINKELREIFTQKGATTIPIEVDQFGLKTELLPPDSKPKFIIVTPSHQFPLGGTLPIQRRIELIEYAKRRGSYIIEDDYDSEYRYAGPPVSSLQGLFPSGVIYVGTYSKVLSPSLRLGYLIFPPSLLERITSIKRFTDYHSPTMEQLILSRFIQEGHLEKHITAMRKIYKQRRDTLIDSLTTEFPNEVTILGASTGLHLVAQFSNVIFTKEKIKQIRKKGVHIVSVEEHTIGIHTHSDKIILGYGNLTPDEIRDGVQRLKKGIVCIEKE